MDFENLNQRIGGCGLYQYIVFVLLAVTTFKFAEDFQGLTFSLFVPQFNCSWKNDTLHNQTSPYQVSKDQCKYKLMENDSWIECQTWVYNKDMLSNSLITEFDLICHNAYYRDLFFTSYFVGCITTYPVVMLSDFIGRRYLMFVAVFLSILVTVFQLFAASLWQHFLLWFLTGAIRTVYNSLTFTTLVELMPQAKRDIAATNYWFMYGVGYTLSALFAFFGRGWRLVSASSLIFTFLYLFYFCYIPETPRWLMLKGRRDQSYKIMAFIAKTNSHTLPRTDFDKWKSSQEETGKFWKLFSRKTMVYRLLVLNFAAWSFNFAYMGSATDLTFASDNIFITTFVMGLVEMPTAPLGGALANKFGRKKGVYLLSSMGVVCLMVMPFLQSDLSKSSWQPWFKMIMAMMAKLGFTSSWLIFEIITSETVPTTDRNSAYTIVYFAVGLGSIVAPTIHNMALQWYFAAPCLIYSLLLSMTIILVWRIIPETRGLPIPQTLDQAVSLVVNKEQEWKVWLKTDIENSNMESSPLLETVEKCDDQ